MNHPLRIDEYRTVSGLFQFEDQEGFPLAFSLGEVVKHDLIVNWGDYFSSAKRAGWPWDLVRKKVEAALSDCPEYPLTFHEACRSVFAIEMAIRRGVTP